MTSPIGPQGDALDTLTLDDAAETSESTAPVTGQPPETLESPPPDQTTETPEPASPSPIEGGPETPAVPPIPQFVAPTGEPFTLRVDRNQIPLEGAVQTPDGGVYFSPESWRKVQAQYVGDRGGWQQERRTLESRAVQAEQARSQRDLKAEKQLDKLAAIFNDPSGELLRQEYENWQVRGPLMVAQAEREALQTERDALAQQVQARQEAEQAAALLPRMEEYLGQELSKVLTAEFAGIFGAEQAKALGQEIWQHHAAQVFYEDQRGTIFVNHDAVRDLVERRASYIRSAKAGQAVVAEKKATNQAVLTPTKPGVAAPKAVTPKVEKARDEETGKFTKQDQKLQRRQALAALDDLTLDDALA
jgi:hypothetical protein